MLERVLYQKHNYDVQYRRMDHAKGLELSITLRGTAFQLYKGKSIALKLILS